jgi:hypothetical protein
VRGRSEERDAGTGPEAIHMGMTTSGRTTSNEMVPSPAPRLTAAHFGLAVQCETGEKSGRRAGVDPKLPICELPDVRIAFTKISDERHAVKILRTDGTSQSIELVSRGFLRHDLAHFAIELEFPIRGGYWGCVSSGASLTGEGVAGSEAQLAESLAGPIQTLFRTDAGPDAYLELLRNVVSPASASQDLAKRVHERVRQLRGHWKATPYGGEMELVWPE